MVRAQAGEVATGTVNGTEVVVVGPSSSSGEWIEVDNHGVEFTIIDGGYSFDFYDENTSYNSSSYYCRWDWCNYGAEIFWDKKEVKRFDEPNISFSGDRIAVVGDSGGSPPDGWREVDDISSLEMSVSILEDGPESLCSGSSAQIEVGVSQTSGVQTISGNIEFINNINDSTTSESFSISPSAGTKRAYTLEIPREVSSHDGSPVTVRVTSNAENSPIEKDIDISIGANPAEVEAGGLSISKGGELCVGARLEPTVSVTNNSDCEAPVNVALTDSVSDSMETETESIASGQSSDVSFRKEIPQQADEGGKVKYTADISSGDTLLSTEELEVNIGSASLDFVSANGPTAACTGEEFTIEAEAPNNGSCEGRARFRVTNSDTDFNNIVVSESVRVGSSISMRLDRTIPDSLSSLDNTTYSVELQERIDGSFQTVSTKEIDIEINSPSISLNTVSTPDSVCPGQQYNINVEYSNEGDCEGRVRIQATENASGESTNSSPDGVRANSSSDNEFSFTLPTDQSLESEGQFTVDVTAQVPAPDGGWEDIATITESVSVDDRVIALSSFDAPSGVCVGEQFSVEAELQNNGNCPAETRVSLVNPQRDTSNTTDSQVIEPQEEARYEVAETIPVDSVDRDQVSLELSLQYRSGGGFVEFGSTEISVVPNTFNLAGEASTVSTGCAGKQIEIDYIVENTGNCGTTAIVEATNVDSGETTEVGSYSISAGGNISDSSSVEVPAFTTDTDSTSYNVTVYGLREDNRVRESETQITTEVITSEVNIQDISYPEYQKPGQKSKDLLIGNTGECSTTVVVNVDSEEFSSELAPGDEVAFTHEYNLPVSGTEFSITVSDEVLEQEVVTEDVEISTHKYAVLDTADGTFKLVGGFDSDIPYRGTISGSDIQGTDDLEDRDNVLVPGSSGTFNGTIGTSAEETDTIEFSTLQYLNVAIVNPIVWVVNGEIKDESPSFRYNTLASQTLNIGEKLALDHSPEVKVNGKVRYNYGALRRKLGVSSVPPSIKVVRRLSR
jgi:hypothetical protein